MGVDLSYVQSNTVVSRSPSVSLCLSLCKLDPLCEYANEFLKPKQANTENKYAVEQELEPPLCGRFLHQKSFFIFATPPEIWACTKIKLATLNSVKSTWKDSIKLCYNLQIASSKVSYKQHELSGRVTLAKFSLSVAQSESFFIKILHRATFKSSFQHQHFLLSHQERVSPFQ